MLIVLMLAALSSENLRSDTVTTNVDLIEVNVFYGDDRYNPIFAQLVFWDWNPKQGRFNVVAWRLMKDAWDLSDEDHRKSWEEWCDKFIESHESFRAKQEITSRLKMNGKYRYSGKFVGGSSYPTKRQDGRWRSVFYSGSERHEVIAPLFRMTQTRIDPERIDRQFLSENRRRGLDKHLGVLHEEHGVAGSFDSFSVGTMHFGR